MSQYRLPDRIPPPCPGNEAGWARWVRDKWNAVRITHLRTTPLGADIPGRVRIRVNVHLGALAPADVLVQASADGAEATDVSGEWPIRLCSTQSYGNGTYVFDGLLPAHGVENRRRLAVRVRPGAAHEALSTLREVRRLFELQSDSARDANDGRRARTRLEPVTG
jgi:hypothetical protein